MRTAVLPSDEASFKIHSVLKQTGVMWMKPDMQSWKPMQWFSQEFLNAEEPQVDGTCKPYARDISPLSARWEKCEWSETLAIAYFLIYVFAMFFDVACFFRSRMFSCDEFSLCSCFILICFVCVCELYMTIWIRYVCLCWITPCYAVCGVRAMPLCEGQGLFIRLQLDVSNSCL